jgi:hypothetical protein
MEDSIDIKVDERIAHLSEKDINDLIDSYYNNIKAKDLVAKYNININPSKLYMIFPPIVCEDTICPYCGQHMFIKRVSKSARMYSTSTAYCIKCGHEDSKICRCTHCQEKRKLLLIREQEEKNKLIEEKKNLIYDTYNIDRYNKIKLKDISFKQRIYLGALLRLALTEDMKLIKPLDCIEGKLAPTKQYTKEILRELSSNKVILINPNSDIAAFPESSEDAEFPDVYYINKVSYVLNIDFGEETEEHIEKIINPSEISNDEKEEALEIWEEIALQECLEYLYYQMDKVKFDFTAGEKTIGVFRDLLKNFSVSQIYGIIYKSIANATKYFQETNITKKQAANSVIGNCQKYGERAIIEQWELAKYRRTYELPQSMISEFFFNRITKIGNLGFEMPPSIL